MAEEASWTIYQDEKKEWRWKRVTRDGKEVGTSIAGFKTLAEAVANAKLNGYKGNKN